MVARPRSPFLALLAVLSLAVVGAGIAWACTPQATLDQPNPGSGEAGTDVTLSGRGFPAEEAVRIRWNDANGPLLATVNANANQAFTVTVRVPADAAEGTYVFLAVPQEPRYTARAAFAVTSAQAAQPAPAPAQEQPATQPPAPAAAEQPATGAPAAGTPPTARRPARTPARRREPAARRAPASVRRPAAAPARPTAPVVQTTSAQPAFGGSVAPAQTARPARAERARPARKRGSGTPARRGPQPSEATAGSDLWSGFAGAPARPGLGSATAPAAATSSALTIGLGLLGLGLMTMAGGFGAVAVRRRRAPARTDRQDS